MIWVVAPAIVRVHRSSPVSTAKPPGAVIPAIDRTDAAERQPHHVQAAKCTHRRKHPGPVVASAARPPASDELSSTTVAAFDTPAPRVPGFQPTGRKDSHPTVIRRPRP